MSQLEKFESNCANDPELRVLFYDQLRSGNVAEIVQLARWQGFAVPEEEIRARLGQDSSEPELTAEQLQKIAGGYSQSTSGIDIMNPNL